MIVKIKQTKIETKKKKDKSIKIQPVQKCLRAKVSLRAKATLRAKVNLRAIFDPYPKIPYIEVTIYYI